MKLFISLCFLLVISNVSVSAQSSKKRDNTLNHVQQCTIDMTKCRNIRKNVDSLIARFEKGEKELIHILTNRTLAQAGASKILEFWGTVYENETELFLTAIANEKPNVQRIYIEAASFYALKDTSLLKTKLLSISSQSPKLSPVAKVALDEMERTSKPYYFSGFEFPVVYGNRGDGYPDELLVEGTIVQASTNSGRCGGLAYAGTMKVRLNNKIEGYNSDFVYILVTCFFDNNEGAKYIGQCVKLRVKKLYEDDYQYSAILSNANDSDGVPFYVTNFFGENKFLERIRFDECLK